MRLGAERRTRRLKLLVLALGVRSLSVLLGAERCTRPVRLLEWLWAGVGCMAVVAVALCLALALLRGQVQGHLAGCSAARTHMAGKALLLICIHCFNLTPYSEELLSNDLKDSCVPSWLTLRTVR